MELFTFFPPNRLTSALWSSHLGLIHPLFVRLISHNNSAWRSAHIRSEEHTSELQSPCNLVCRLLLEKKKQVHGRAPRVRPVGNAHDDQLPRHMQQRWQRHAL